MYFHTDHSYSDAFICKYCQMLIFISYEQFLLLLAEVIVSAALQNSHQASG